MAILRTEEERKEFIRLKAIEESKVRTLPQYLLEPVKPRGNEFDPFITTWIIDGETCKLELRPEGGYEKIDGRFPSLFGVGRNHTHYRWLQIVNGKWKWFSNERDEELAEVLGGWVVVGWYG